MSRRIAVALAMCALITSAGAVSAAEIFVTANPDNTFTPANVVINVGDTVTWTNAGGLHNVEATDGSFRCANGCDGDGMGGNGDPATNPWSASVTFTEAGVTDYVCVVHVGIGMVGSVTVLDGGGDLSLDIVGNNCPGDIDLTVSGGTPGGAIAFARAANEGMSEVPVGSCAGTELGLANPSLLTILTADGNGEINLSRSLTPAQCGLVLQAIDITTCGTSNTATLP